MLYLKKLLIFLSFLILYEVKKNKKNLKYFRFYFTTEQNKRIHFLLCYNCFIINAK